MNGRVYEAGAWRDDGDAPDAPDASAQGILETLGAHAGALPLWSRHLRRMRAAARHLRLPWRPPPDLEATVCASLHRHRHDVARVRLLRTGGRALWSVHTRRRDQEVEPLRVTLAPAPRPADATDACKVWPRAWLGGVRAAAQAAGSHDAIVWRGDHVLEATAYNVFVLVDGHLRTPPCDGSILPGIGRAILLGAGLPAVEAPVTLAELRASPLVLLVNAVYGPRLSTLRDGDGAGPRDLLVRARAAWRQALGG